MKIKVNSLWNSIVTMGMGTILAQVINFVAQPVLSRIFPTDELGIYTYVISFASMIIPIASLKLDMLVVSEEDEDKAQYLTDASALICFLVSFICLVVIAIGYCFRTTNIFNKYGAIIFLVPLIIFTNGIRFLMISYNNRYREYKLIVRIGIIRESARALIQIIAGLLSLGSCGLAFGFLIAPVFAIRQQAKEYIARLKKRSLITFSRFMQVVIESKHHILCMAPAQFINTFTASFITITISELYTDTILGYYSLGTRLLEVPIIFISSNISKVCYKEISENVTNRKPVAHILIKITKVIAVVSVLGFGLLFLIAPKLTRIVFGSGYEISGIYIRCLCVMYAIRLISTSFAGVFTIFGKQKYELGLNVMLICTAVGAFLFAKLRGIEMTDYLWLISIGYSVMYLLMFAGYFVLCKRYDGMLASSQEQ